MNEQSNVIKEQDQECDKKVDKQTTFTTVSIVCACKMNASEEREREKGVRWREIYI